MKGYAEDGQQIPFATNIAGAFIHEANHDRTAPWQLPKSWHDQRKKLNLQTPFNFVSTADIIGGNSGSPVINRDGEFVGIIFDGNIHSLTADYVYSDTIARATSVDVGVIRQALGEIYNAKRLLQELDAAAK